MPAMNPVRMGAINLWERLQPRMVFQYSSRLKLLPQYQHNDFPC